MTKCEIALKVDAKGLMKDLREEMRLVFEAGHKAGFDAADKTSRSQASHVVDAWEDFAAELFKDA
jgi:hypothetical protein